jgi:hypothetical protein
METEFVAVGDPEEEEGLADELLEEGLQIG